MQCGIYGVIIVVVINAVTRRTSFVVVENEQQQAEEENSYLEESVLFPVNKAERNVGRNRTRHTELAECGLVGRTVMELPV